MCQSTLFEIHDSRAAFCTWCCVAMAIMSYTEYNNAFFFFLENLSVSYPPRASPVNQPVLKSKQTRKVSLKE